MKIKHFLKSVVQGFCKIKLVDRCLIIFMVLLMIQTSYSLFFNALNTQNTNDIDIIIRTTSAGIFGYFLSVNFLKSSLDHINFNKKESDFQNRKILNIENTGIPSNEGIKPRIEGRIGFNPSLPDKDTPNLSESLVSPPELEKKLEEEYGDDYEEEKSLVTNQQIIIATVIGLVSLLTLVIVRNFLTLTPNMTASISQLRDFVSGCVGFLLGCPTGGTYLKKSGK